MGGVYINKAVLLDERDITEFCGFEPASFELLSTLADDCAEDRLGNWDHPIVQILGCCSERFDTSELRSYDCRSMWLSEGKSWGDTLGNLCADLGGLDRSTTGSFLVAEDRDHLIADVSAQIGGCLAEAHFGKARKLVTALENLAVAGLPCFRDAIHLTGGGDEDAYDLRDANHGAGRRVIVEMAFVWE